MRQPDPTNKRLSIEDVAKRAGVSITTVSRVINKIPTVSLKNKQKVEEAIKELKFKPSLLAQRLAKGANNAIGLIIPRYENIFYSFSILEIIRGIGFVCDNLKLDLLLHITDGRTFIDPSSVGGVIFVDIIGNRTQLEQILKEGIPAIVINNFVEDLPVSCLAVDNENGAKEAVNYLIGLGHKKIAHITGDLATQSAAKRFDGYKKSLEENKISFREDYVIRCDYSRGKARFATEQILGLADRPTAIFVASDSMALESMTVIIEKGLKVPDNISLVGFDDNPSGLYGAVALTTVKQPLQEIGKEAVKELDLFMRGEKKQIEKKILPTQLIVRDSCKEIK
ncbi:MAG: LacI family DNA-binding transcriptional regulator [Candidatus Omnitrophota bacterium]